MKKYFIIILLIFAALISHLFIFRNIRRDKFNKDLSIHELPHSLRTGAFEQRGNIQWSDIYGDPSICLSWAIEKGWQERYSKGDNISESLSQIESNMLKAINIRGKSVEVENINFIFNKIIDRTDAGYLILINSPSDGYCAILVVFRT